MRRRLLLAATAFPLALGVTALVAPGCGSDEPPIDDVCSWIQDPANCYRGLYDEVQTRCGATFNPDTPLGEREQTEPKGRFLRRDALDLCVLENGGQVKFDSLPPLDEFPVTSMAFTRIDARSEPCAKVTYTNTFNLSVTLFPCSQDENDLAPVCLDSLTGTESVSGAGRDPNTVIGGSFSVASEEGRDIFNATCPQDAEGNVKTYRFNRYEADKCEGYSQHFPSAEIESDPGGTVPPWEEDLKPYEGWVRFRLHHPPYAAAGDIKGKPAIVLQYFDCTIPPQDPCDDGIKNFYETDTDCGGPTPGGVPPGTPEAPPAIRSCERCEIGQICASNSDCKEGVCVFDSFTGFNKCTANGGAGGA